MEKTSGRGSGIAEDEWKTVGRLRGKGKKRVRWENLVTVFVNNLPEVTVAEQLKIAFSPMGKVFDAFIPASSGRGRGVFFGFVRFREMETAIKAVDATNGKIFAGRKMEIKVAKFGWSERLRGGLSGEKARRGATVDPQSKVTVSVLPKEDKK